MFRRGRGSLYRALADGRINDHHLRQLLINNLPAEWPLAGLPEMMGTWPAEKGCLSWGFGRVGMLGSCYYASL